MKKYKIPVIWQSWGLITVEANNLEEAKKKVIEDEPLPNGEYIDDSFKIDEEGIPIYNKGVK